MPFWTISKLNANNYKALLDPNITLAKIIPSRFFGVFSQTLFHVLQSDSSQYKPPFHKKQQKHSVESNIPHSQTELNLLQRKIKNF